MKTASWVAGAVLLVTLPLWLANPYFLHVVIMAGNFSILALPLNLLLGYTRPPPPRPPPFFRLGAHTPPPPPPRPPGAVLLAPPPPDPPPPPARLPHPAPP